MKYRLALMVQEGSDDHGLCYALDEQTLSLAVGEREVFGMVVDTPQGPKAVHVTVKVAKYTIGGQS